MRTLREWMHRLFGTVLQRRRDDDLEAELRAHAALAAEHGRRATGTAQAMDALRDQRGISALDNLARDARYGLRMLGRSPVFTAVAVVSLALGIGANAAIFHVIDTLNFRPLAIARAEELVEIHADGTDGFGINEGPNGRVTYPLWEQFRTHQQALSGIFSWADATFLVGRGRDARTADGLLVSGDYFRVLGVTAYRGRLLTAGDDQPGCGAGVAVVSHDFWQAALGGTDDVVGRRVTVLNQPFTVAGVVPPGFTGLEVGRSFDVALPMCSAALWRDRLEHRDRWWLTVMGRLKPGWTVKRANDHMRALSPGALEATLPSNYGAELLDRYRGFRFGAYPAARGVSRLRVAHGTSLSLLLALTGLVLLITCGNLATLMVARASAREREMSVRAALGASRGRLASQMLVESVLVVLMGAAASLLVALASARALVAFLETPQNPIALTFEPDWRLLAFIGLAAVLTTLLFGLLPAVRVSMADPIAAAQRTSRGSTPDRQGARMRRGLVVVEIALALMLAVSAVLFVRSFRNLADVDLGFDARDLLQVSFVDLDAAALTVEQRLAFQRRLAEEIRSAPGVASAASSSHFLLSGGNWAHFFKVPGRDDDTRVSRFAYVDPEYFATLRIPIVAGRAFDARDRTDGRRVAIVSEHFVRSHLSGRDPIGAAIRTVAEAGYPETTYEVVGVARNTKYTDVRDEQCWCDADVEEAMPPIAYVPIAQNPSPFPWSTVIVRRDGPAAAVRSAIEGRVAQLNPGIVVNITGLEEQIRQRLVTERIVAWLAGAFGVLAVVLVIVGLYGLIAYLTARRRAEIGIRLSLGSTRGQIVRLVLRDSVWLVAAGVLIGVPLAVATMRGAGALLFGVSSTDVATLIGATVLLAAAAVLAGTVPAWRASRFDPATVLRAE